MAGQRLRSLNGPQRRGEGVLPETARRKAQNHPTADVRVRTYFAPKRPHNPEMLSDLALPDSPPLRGGRGHLAYDKYNLGGLIIMPGWGRDDRKRLPDFYLSPAV